MARVAVFRTGLRHAAAGNHEVRLTAWPLGINMLASIRPVFSHCSCYSIIVIIVIARIIAILGIAGIICCYCHYCDGDYGYLYGAEGFMMEVHSRRILGILLLMA